LEKKDIVIIGGGPAGLAAGLYASRAALNVTLLEKGMPGGLMANTEMIENYPGFAEGIGGPELTMRMQEQAVRFGLQIDNAGVESIDRTNTGFIIKTDEGDIESSTVILATGASPRWLNVKGEKEFHGRGVSYCATCDGAFFKDKKVAVVGGGDAAVEEALFLTKFAEKVYIIHRRDELRATKVIQEKAKNNPKIEFQWNSVVDEIKGSATVEGVTLRDTQDHSIKEIAVDGVFIYVGTQPSSGLVANMVELDPKGYIITDDQMRTLQPGLFAAGDVRQKLLRQVVTAVADGAIAAFAAEKYLEEQSAKK
jgi:thioredoxin reductase (NADPH)